MASDPIAPEVAGLSHSSLSFSRTWLPEHLEFFMVGGFTRSSRESEMTVSVPFGIEFGPCEIRSVRGPEDRVRYNTIVVENKVSSLITLSSINLTADAVYLTSNLGIGYSDPANPCSGGGGGSGSERPDDGLLYPRGQG